MFSVMEAVWKECLHTLHLTNDNDTQVFYAISIDILFPSTYLQDLFCFMANVVAMFCTYFALWIMQIILFSILNMYTLK